jgi:D-serine deaminase-like pyridoxal phosphate-dependent protein
VHSRWQQIPGLECSPGTFVLHDAGYGSKYADLAELIPAAALMTRVISRPHPRRVTLDLGTKAVAADPPLERRVRLLDVPEYTVVAHNEEHLVIETPAAEQFQIGDVLYALPGHICPTVALYRELLVVENGIVADRWLVAARDRSLTV